VSVGVLVQVATCFYKLVEIKVQGETRVLDVILKSFDAPDETSVFEKRKFEIVRTGGMTMVMRITFRCTFGEQINTPGAG
jgi:hypothetical protein